MTVSSDSLVILASRLRLATAVCRMLLVSPCAMLMTAVAHPVAVPTSDAPSRRVHAKCRWLAGTVSIDGGMQPYASPAHVPLIDGAHTRASCDGELPQVHPPRPTRATRASAPRLAGLGEVHVSAFDHAHLRPCYNLNETGYFAPCCVDQKGTLCRTACLPQESHAQCPQGVCHMPLGV